MTLAYADSINIYAQFSGTAGAWTDITDDVIWPLSGGYGITSSSPTERVASTGTMTFSLDNSANNSAGLVGYYSPGHINCRTGFQAGITVKLEITYDMRTYCKFYGRVPAEGIRVLSGIYGQRKTEVEVRDYMEIIGSHEITLPALAENKRIDEAVPLVLANMPIQPLGTEYNTGISTFTTVFDTVRKRGTSKSELDKMALSELGYIYIRRGFEACETLVVEGRTHRNETPITSSVTTPSADSGFLLMETGDYLLQENGDRIILDEAMDVSFHNTQTDVSVLHGANLANIIKTQTYPRAIDTSATVLWSLNSSMQIAAGETKTGYAVRYRDPVGGAPTVAGKNMITPAATTDYLMNSHTAGTGTNLTANLTVSVDYGAEGAAYTLQNTGTQDAYITRLQARGYGIYMYDPIAFTVEDAASQLIHGTRTLQIDARYQGDPTLGEAYANNLLYKYSSPESHAETVSYYANRSSSFMGAFLQIDIGGKVRIAEDVTGIDEDYFVNAVAFNIMAGGVIDFTWTVKSASFDVYETWELEVAGLSELGLTTYLSF